MRDFSTIKARYLKEPFNNRIGHLASNLAKIATFLENPENIKIVEDILEESKFFIEWAAPEAPFDIQVLFSEMQSKLALWHYRLTRPNRSPIEIEELKKVSKLWSVQVLESSGLLT